MKNLGSSSCSDIYSSVTLNIQLIMGGVTQGKTHTASLTWPSTTGWVPCSKLFNISVARNFVCKEGIAPTEEHFGNYKGNNV